MVGNTASYLADSWFDYQTGNWVSWV